MSHTVTVKGKDSTQATLLFEIAVNALRIEGEQATLHVIHARRPNSELFVKLQRCRMIGNRHVGIDRALSRPVFEAGMERRELIDVIPDIFEDRTNDLVRQRLVRRNVDIVGVHAAILGNSGSLAALEPVGVVTGDGSTKPLFPLRRAI